MNDFFGAYLTERPVVKTCSVTYVCVLVLISKIVFMFVYTKSNVKV